jgi:hypothetical protein
MTTVNPHILVWARETAGYDLFEAARKLGLKDGKAAAADEKLAACESGEKAPSRPLLLKMAKQYRRPLLTFYLDSPPARHQEHQKQKNKESSGGPSYYVLKRMQNGNALIGTSERLMRSGELSTMQAAIVLGVRALKVGNLLSQPNAA